MAANDAVSEQIVSRFGRASVSVTTGNLHKSGMQTPKKSHPVAALRGGSSAFNPSRPAFHLNFLHASHGPHAGFLSGGHRYVSSAVQGKYEADQLKVRGRALHTPLGVHHHTYVSPCAIMHALSLWLIRPWLCVRPHSSRSASWRRRRVRWRPSETGFAVWSRSCRACTAWLQGAPR